MLKSFNQLYGESLYSTDGGIGHVRDFYFDDHQWAVRYVVAETGPWLKGRLVLISPHAIINSFQEGRGLVVNLTRQQIEQSPPIDSHKLVSRQFEAEYYRYYGWPAYWDGGEMRGASTLPLASPFNLIPEEKIVHVHHHTGVNRHLRSTQALGSYLIQTDEGAIGHVKDFIIQNKSWAVRNLLVETNHWFSRREITISPRDIKSISYENSMIKVTTPIEGLQEESEYHGHQTTSN